MKVFALWHGGTSYALGTVDDIEEFDSIEEAKREFQRRSWTSETFYPVVDDTAFMNLYSVDPRELTDPWPDRVVVFGPRGGVSEEVRHA